MKNEGNTKTSELVEWTDATVAEAPSRRALWLKLLSPGQAVPLVRAWFQYTKVASSIPGQGTYRNQPMNA